jgi:hypothetical protein
VAVREGPDTDDEEAPLMLAGDRGLICDQEMAGTRCAHSEDQAASLSRPPGGRLTRAT